jgi:CHAD domain-containing protein
MAESNDNPFPLLAYLDGLVEQLQKDTPKALREFDVDAIHDARVATRRLKAATGLLAPILHGDSSKKFEKALRKLRRRLGPLRDGDVMIEHLSKLRAGTHAAAVQWLSDALSSHRDAARADAAKQGPGKVLAKLAGWWELRDGIAESQEAVDSLLSQAVHLQLDAFIEDASQTGNPHELRIVGKGLRYTLEMAAEQGHKLPKSVLKTFKTIQQYLGDWHDNVVIVQAAMGNSLDTELTYKDMALQQQVLNLGRLFATRAQKEFAKFTSTWADSGEQLAAQIRDAFPLTQPVTESKTDPDPSGSEEPAVQEAPPSDVAASA